jgi:hypothetical protein
MPAKPLRYLMKECPRVGVAAGLTRWGRDSLEYGTDNEPAQGGYEGDRDPVSVGVQGRQGSAEPIRAQRSDSNTAVIVVAGRKVAQDAECRAAGDRDPVSMRGMRPGQERDASVAMTS